MLSYQHRYHAGNFADLHKHLALMLVLQHMQLKDTPFCVLDCFAGEGIYDLDCSEALRMREYAQGYELMMKGVSRHQQFETLQSIAQNIGESSRIKRPYPGSPAIINHFLRPEDRAHFVEKHPQAILALRKFFQHISNIHIHDRDGFDAILALTPFEEKRGFVFIDPSYEIKSEYEKLASVTSSLLKRCRQMPILIWYPILEPSRHKKLIQSLQSTGHEHSIVEWLPDFQATSSGLKGSGVILLNPIHHFEKNLKHLVELLSHTDS